MKTVRYPDGHVLLRNLSREMPVISHGEGVYLFDRAGKRYFDASSGALVVSVGHGNTYVAERIAAQLCHVAYVNGTQFTSDPTETLATMICENAPPGLTRAAFLSSGSEVVEAAVKFARQLWVERGQGQRSKLIARVPSYHGNTLYALSLSGRPHYKKYYGPMLSEVATTDSPYEYRCGLPSYQKDGAAHYARLLEAVIAREGADTIAAFIAEPVIGSSAGAALPPPGYFEAISAVCRRHGILTIADEILCGSGRTGQFFASTQFGFAPDILVLGKGLGGGYIPLSALLVKGEHVEELRAGTGYFMHAQTYLQAPAMCSAGVATLEYMREHGLVENAASVGKSLQLKLRDRLLPLPTVGNVSGVGLLAGIEFVADKQTRAPFPRKEKFAEGLTQFLFEQGVIVWPNVGQANGIDGDLIMIGPPLITTEGQVDELVDALALGLERFVERRP